jgi:hypothetical protein
LLPPASQQDRILGIDVCLFPFEAHIFERTPTPDRRFD